MTKSALIPLLLAATLVLTMAVPASAVLQVTEYRGTITSLNSTSNTMTISAVAPYGCDYTNTTPNCSWTSMNATAVNGTVPDNQVFSDFKSGDSVAAAILGGPGGNWAAVALIFPTPGIENWYATEIHGDPVYVENVPLAADYAVATLTTPDCTNCTGTVCTASSALVEIRSSETVVKNVTLTPGQNVTYGRTDGSSIAVQFLSGQAASSDCPNAGGMMTGPQPVSDFIIHVKQPVATPTTTISTTAPTTTAPTTVAPTTTTAGMSTVVIVSALGLIGLFMARIRK